MAENLTDLAVADRPKRMGRPPLHVKPLTVRLTDDLRARIEAVVGPNRIAQFLRDAAEEKLARREPAVVKEQAKKDA